MTDLTLSRSPLDTLDTLDSATLIRQVRQAASPTALVQAVQALAQLRDGPALAMLIEVLGYNNPAAAVIAMQGLIAWGPEAVPVLIERLDGYNYGARAYAVRALAALGDGRALAILVQAALYDFAPSVRRAAAKGLGRLYAADPEQIFTSLCTLIQDEDWSIRYAAVVSLETVGQSQGTAAHACLQQVAQTDADAVVQARAALALQRLLP